MKYDLESNFRDGGFLVVVGYGSNNRKVGKGEFKFYIKCYYFYAIGYI